MRVEKALLSAHAISKYFGTVQVLFDVDFELHSGEVHGLVGENGAGKSTLMKILSGFERATSGSLVLAGQPVAWNSGEAAENAGVILIHQEFNLAEQLSVEANIFLGRELRRGPFLAVDAMRRQARAMLERLDSHVPLDARVADISISDKQMVEIAKALSRNVRVLIMDEPTAVLTQSESQTLFDLIEKLKAEGVAILFTSHKLEEVAALADRVTVLRDGRRVTTTSPEEKLAEDKMANMMVGREISDLFPDLAPLPDTEETVLEVKHLRVPGYVEDASFSLRRGEVLGFAGLIGAGRTELMEAVVGLRSATSGEVIRNGHTVRINSFKAATALGIVYLTEDRKGRGLLLNQALIENLTLLELASSRSVFIDPSRERHYLQTAIAEFDINAPDPSAPISTLSGGNQQKLLLAKTMLIEPEIVIIDEPTRGIDIGTKQQIYIFIQNLVASGKSCIMISSEMAEVIRLSHRVMVMRQGRITGELAGSRIEESTIVRYATGLEEDTQHALVST